MKITDSTINSSILNTGIVTTNNTNVINEFTNNKTLNLLGTDTITTLLTNEDSEITSDKTTEISW